MYVGMPTCVFACTNIHTPSMEESEVRLSASVAWPVTGHGTVADIHNLLSMTPCAPSEGQLAGIFYLMDNTHFHF